MLLYSVCITHTNVSRVGAVFSITYDITITNTNSLLILKLGEPQIEKNPPNPVTDKTGIDGNLMNRGMHPSQCRYYSN